MIFLVLLKIKGESVFFIYRDDTRKENFEASYRYKKERGREGKKRRVERENTKEKKRKEK